jgi:hypothetical protein
VEDEQIGRAGPPFGRDQRAQPGFHLHRIVDMHEAQAIGDAQDVPIHGQARDAERVPEHHIGGLAADAREFCQGVHVGRHLSAMPLDEPTCHAHQRPGLLPEEPRRLDGRFELREVCAGQRVRVGIPLEQRWGDDVDPAIRGLRLEDSRDQQLERVAEV